MDGFTNDCGGSWWVILLFLFAFNGWGGNGANRGIADNYVLNSDFSTLSRQLESSTSSLERKGDAINNGLCSGFYESARIADGIQQSISTNGYETRTAITNAQIAEMQNANALQRQLADCCCTNSTALANSTREIVDNANSNTRAILDALNAQILATKDAKIAEQSQQIFGLQLKASQEAQNAYLINQLAPKVPIPSFTVPNPFNGCCGCN